jgi:hypothetical protein
VVPIIQPGAALTRAKLVIVDHPPPRRSLEQAALPHRSLRPGPIVVIQAWAMAAG